MAVLIFGAAGSIGAYLFKRMVEDGRSVYGTTRTACTPNLLYYDPSDPATMSGLAALPSLQAVIWCQGTNCNDEVGELELSQYLAVMDGNVHFVARSLNLLLTSGKLAQGSRLLIVSSLWQEFTRSHKFSYTVSKSALGGLVRSCSVDLGSRGIYINAVLPGPIDNEMTRANLTDAQIATLPGFVDMADLYHLSTYLCFHNNSTNGQSLVVDLGFSVRRMC